MSTGTIISLAISGLILILLIISLIGDKNGASSTYLIQGLLR
jgi:hypothetical protein